ncbi:type I restriction enzyme HsdR N-terminal domain-containing protein [Zeaxanthinibacter sp. PT1]|uniref:type I restriction enzyme HsdR N-terminal domain-containing protein n=1 Tax=Zeaxanthinibacter TaxID=561554 RepID=UPI002349EA4B|nr:type I restriction enzyme HsdR N-terminal domain-containing protein [Zeaxanthinibacter sp. PT1]MDC6351427.1 type I restriction enzyme HsdR N-terminal domain-containing protein [Zeaxanthinibacter sp. PT1]
MQRLNFPSYQFRFKSSENKVRIFDLIRKKFVLLQPEEWVRQHVLLYLHKEMGYPAGHLNVEKQLEVNRLKKRYDIVVFNPDGSLEVLVECKAPQVKITQDTFDQIARYNLQLRSRYLMVTNGLEHFYCRLHYDEQRYEFLPALPRYSAHLRGN